MPHTSTSSRQPAEVGRPSPSRLRAALAVAVLMHALTLGYVVLPSRPIERFACAGVERHDQEVARSALRHRAIPVGPFGAQVRKQAQHCRPSLVHSASWNEEVVGLFWVGLEVGRRLEALQQHAAERPVLQACFCDFGVGGSAPCAYGGAVQVIRKRHDGHARRSGPASNCGCAQWRANRREGTARQQPCAAHRRRHGGGTGMRWWAGFRLSRPVGRRDHSPTGTWHEHGPQVSQTPAIIGGFERSAKRRSGVRGLRTSDGPRAHTWCVEAAVLLVAREQERAAGMAALVGCRVARLKCESTTWRALVRPKDRRAQAIKGVDVPPVTNSTLMPAVPRGESLSRAAVHAERLGARAYAPPSPRHPAGTRATKRCPPLLSSASGCKSGQAGGVTAPRRARPRRQWRGESQRERKREALQGGRGHENLIARRHEGIGPVFAASRELIALVLATIHAHACGAR
eukprot:335554-Chlamydomonas_euryale.AAC.8